MATALKNVPGFIIAILIFMAAIPAAASADDFEVLFIGQQTIDNQNCIALTFSAAVDAKRDINRFLAILSEDQGEVTGAWVLTNKGNVAYFTNIEADTNYEVQIRKGLQAADGRTLSANKSQKVRTRRASSFVSFTGKGYILPADLANGLPVSTMNVKAVDIDFFRIKEKYLVDFINFFGENNQLSYYHSEQIQRFSDLVYSARFDLEAPKNVLAKVLLPLRDIDPLEKPGLYLTVLRPAGVYQYDNPATYFTISDIGLHLRVYPNQMEIQTQHLASGKTMGEVTIRILDKEGRLLARQQTDKEGRASFANLMEKAQLLLADKGSQTSILPLNVPALDLSAFSLSNQPFHDLELFVYGPRDLYRPGETVILDGLLRDYDGRSIDHKAPIEVTIKQPDGQQAKTFIWHSQALNAFHHEYALPAGAQTGTWIAEFKLAQRLIQLYQFKVEDFMPERMKLTLDGGNTDVTRIGPEDALSLDVQGDYLYGAPAAGNRVDCRVSMILQRKLVEKLPGFEFGHVDEKVPPDFDTEELLLDDQGKGVIEVEKQWAEVKSPLKIRLHASVYESGGRPVSRDKVYHLWPAQELVGVRPLWEGEQPDGDSLVEFEVVKTNAAGELLGAKGLAVSVIREYPDYYWEYNASSGWERIVNYQNYPVARFELDVKPGEAAKISFPVEWGPYRLEITDPKTELVTAHRFSAGWYWWGRGAAQQGNRPDQVVLTLDKPSYHPGDTAKVLIKAPEAGTALVTVETDQPLWHKIIEVSAQGTEVQIPVAADWDRHDIHISAMVIRPGDRRHKISPKRSLGLVHLPLERNDRRLDVTIDAPLKARPNAPLDVDLTVADAAGKGDIYITLAAVDVGVLSITRYETPDPWKYYFSPRRYGVDCYDLYQKIIEGLEGSVAKQRFGGDADLEMTRGGDKPVTDVQIVSLYQGQIRVDADGKAKVTLDLPDFNGRLRIMAVAYSDKLYGSAEKEVTVAAPVVAEIAMPRFLAMGDEAFLALDVQNLSGLDQQMTVALTTTAPIILTGNGQHTVALKDKAKTTLRFAVRADYDVGAGDIDLTVSGIRSDEGNTPVSFKRHWRLGTRPAYPALTRQWRKSLEPGQQLEIGADALKNLMPKTVRAGLTLTDQPSINVAEYVQALFAYPYGCLEQTTSGIYPQVFITSQILDQLKIKNQTEESRRKKVAEGIDRLIALQLPSGGFGLWSNNSPEECWLTAYVCDFLITARDQGYTVPEEALGKAFERLNNYLRRANTIHVRYTDDDAHAGLAVQAYSAFVLSRVGRAPLGTMRTLFDNHAKDSRSGLPMVHLGLALDRQGDGNRAKAAFDLAVTLTPKEHDYLGDYGSPLRDAAMAYYLLASNNPRNGHAGAWLVKLDEALRDRRWLSTQEQNALVLAGMQLLKGSGKTWQAALTLEKKKETVEASQSVQYRYDAQRLREGLRIEAAGRRPLYVTFLLSGYSRTAPAAESHDIDINRTYYDLQGKEMALKQLKTGDMVLVRLDVHSKKRVSEGLVVELLPAGLELENQNLSTGFNPEHLQIDGKTIAEWKENLKLAHEEFRDDRYVAAIDVDNYQPATLFYLARAVSPGVFRVPNSYVEDMYRPYIQAIGETVETLKIVQP